ncbi:MAG: TonB-dependent receptor plug domain-containing protein, partial [Myxococcota bacterium]
MQLLSRRGRAVSFGPLVVAAAVGLLSPGAAHAQTADGVEEETPSDEATEATDEQTERRSRGGADAATENIVITGTKKARREFASDAPVAVSAFSDEKLEAMQFRDIESLSFSIPNVSLDSVGTAKGVANFSIRGLGANSSIPTIDPTVGLFVNGVYFGTNAGAVLDSFDLEAVEVLRGPQGILFGRNVTGGAVLMRTKRPGDTYGASIKANVETGLESRIYGAVDLPVLPDLLKFRVAGQFRNDDGWFTNLRNLDDPDDDTQFGAEQTWLVRPTVSFTPGPLTVHVMYERGQTEAQGPPAQSTMDPSGTPGPFTGFDFSIDEEGVANYFW